ncbi:neutral zinc metallopeptidase [Hyphomicrobium sp. NDB2Meth4]|uniref:neutral zinc metallopeptidase n=1 Tax=Hyphomicrobium sp. NDB2Meth4 TaxID=1892846 RepID=UPI00092FE231|nr:neutral zinc metallopeptidase [Hyphomicrobium sp. NDB2Meth4]
MKQPKRIIAPFAAVLAGVSGLSIAARSAEGPPPGSMEVTITDNAPDTGAPLPELKLRAVVTRALVDSVATWSRLLEGRGPEVASVNVRFVSRLAPNNCYGLYTGDGPAYCSGNHTIFVGTAAAQGLMSKFGKQGEAGITFLIGHEIGHHIQNLDGRFFALSRAIRADPEQATEYVRRFELQADCYAGVWVHDSPAWAGSDQFRADLLAVLFDIGDDQLLAGRPADAIREVGLHGTTEQRTRWFLRGAQTGDIAACDTFAIAQP